MAAAPSAFTYGWSGGARIALHTELILSLLFSERAFSGIVDSLVHKKFLGTSPQNPELALYHWEINILSTVLLEKGLKTKFYPCGGT